MAVDLVFALTQGGFSKVYSVVNNRLTDVPLASHINCSVNVCTVTVNYELRLFMFLKNLNCVEQRIENAPPLSNGALHFKLDKKRILLYLIDFPLVAKMLFLYKQIGKKILEHLIKCLR